MLYFREGGDVMNMRLTINEFGAKTLADSKFKPFEPRQKHTENKEELLEMLKSNFKKNKTTEIVNTTKSSTTGVKVRRK